MLIVSNNASNNITLTLSQDLSTITFTGITSGFYMNLTNEMTNEKFEEIYLTNTSLYTDRYDKFVLTLTGLTSVDYSLSKIYLKDNGYYWYEVYYYADENSELIENGFLKVIGDAVIETIYYDSNDDNTFLSYEK